MRGYRQAPRTRELAEKRRKRPWTQSLRESGAVAGDSSIVEPAASCRRCRWGTSAARARFRHLPRCGDASPRVPSRGSARRGGRFLEGLASRCHDVTGHVLERDSNPRLSDNVRCSTQLSYPVVTYRARTGVSAFPPCLTSRPPSSGIPLRTLRHTPRQRRAHRTGQEPVPLKTCSRMFPIAGCRQPAILVAHRAMRCSILAPPASEHHHAAHMRRLQPRPCLGARTRASRMLQGGNRGFPCRMKRNLFDARASSANAKNRTPPGLATRGRSRASGDRGGRSPREVSRD